MSKSLLPEHDPKHEIPDLRNISLYDLSADASDTAAELRRMILSPEVPVTTAAFNSSIGGDECLPGPAEPSGNSS